MLKRLFTSHHIPFLYLKMVMGGLLLAFTCVWIVTACTQQTTTTQKPSDTTELSQAGLGRLNQSRQLSTDLDTAIEKVADKAIPAVVHIVVKEHQEMANPFYAYKDTNPPPMEQYFQQIFFTKVELAME